VVEFMSPRQLGNQSELVFRGRVESSESYWNDAGTTICTRTRIAVDQTYKGSARAIVEIFQVGGIVDNIMVTVHGACAWRPGEEVVLFAEACDTGDYVVSGFSQGKFSVVRDPRTGEALVRSPRMEGIQVLGAPPGQAAGPGVQREMPLEEFISRALGDSGDRGVQR
jgi:hypothetical protein